MKNSYKKILSLFVLTCLLLTISIVLCSCLEEISITDNTNDTQNTTDNYNNDVNVNSANNDSSNNASNDSSNNASNDLFDYNTNNSLGNYDLTIKSYRLAEDYEGKEIIIIKYLFTNNDDEPSAFYLTFDDKVYQDGIGLNECYFADDSANYSSDNQTKEIKKGASIEVEMAYELNDTTTDVEVEVSRLISLNKNKITKTFKIGS